jgi:hypothetical protein
MGLGAMATQLQWEWTKVAGLALMIAAMLWDGILQSRWFAQELGVSLLNGFWMASVGMVECVAVICVVAPLIA